MGPTNEQKQFMMRYFFGNDVYPADKIDRQENPAIIKKCIDDNYLYEDGNKDYRLYRLTENGKHYLK